VLGDGLVLLCIQKYNCSTPSCLQNQYHLGDPYTLPRTVFIFLMVSKGSVLWGWENRAVGTMATEKQRKG
jgi:hypothetical protein